MFVAHVDFHGTSAILKHHGLEPGGAVQWFFSNEVLRLADSYVPFDNGVLAASGRVIGQGDALIYDTPYARYHWFGKLMVDPITGKGAFFNPKYGFWSRKGVNKVLTDRDMQYQGAPLRGSMWTTRMWADRSAEILKSMEDFIRAYS